MCNGFSGFTLQTVMEDENWGTVRHGDHDRPRPSMIRQEDKIDNERLTDRCVDKDRSSSSREGSRRAGGVPACRKPGIDRRLIMENSHVSGEGDVCPEIHISGAR